MFRTIALRAAALAVKRLLPVARSLASGSAATAERAAVARLPAAGGVAAIKAHMRLLPSGKVAQVAAHERHIPVGIVVGGGAAALAHFGRNALNPSVDPETIKKTWQELPPQEAIYHRMGPGAGANRKFISPNGGHGEAVLGADDKPVTDPRNAASYNYFDPHFLAGLPHAVADVAPYMMLGNTPFDTFTADRFKTTYDALAGPVVYGASVLLAAQQARAQTKKR